MGTHALTAVIIMGVSGVGKTTVGEGLAERLGWRFLEGDDLHSEASVAKMAAGTPLTDEDRWPWLDRIARTIDGWRQEATRGVITCSALKRSYRDRIRAGHDDVLFAHLAGDKALIAGRIQARKHRYMPASLLDSQFATLEPPSEEEGAVIVDVAAPPDRLIEAIVKAVSARL
ncbi:gluconokinase [Marinivivus vitaminiproducens]|uniref:gluconokinase n=1 Tax=Marinivivus vitaminiproducens TaxID=3035935 RepID=UPI0027A896E0|nr:gluconokinase [Geminicoccaceae bacterium SCSIO 64248]